MGQVPVVPTDKKRVHGIYGSGRLARHLIHYLSNINIPLVVTSRAQSPLLDDAAEALEPSDVIWLAVSDTAIRPMYDLLRAHPLLGQKIFVHASGAYFDSEISGFHWLQSFGTTLYPLERYRKIALIADLKSNPYSFPELPNPLYRIKPENKARYHALCSLAGNFSVLLWQKLARDFQNTLGLPKEAWTPYLEQVFLNLAETPDTALTGPLVRGDERTLNAHLNALATDPYGSVYEAFISAYQNSKSENHS